MLAIGKDYTFAEEIILRFLDKRFIVNGNTKKAEELANAQQLTFLETIAECIAAYCNEKRVERFAKVLDENDEKWLPGVYSSDVIPHLRALKEAWDRLSVLDLPPDEKRKRREVFYSDDIPRFMENLIVDEKLREYERERHRKAVLEGRESATAEDAGWLDELRIEAVKRAEQLEAAAKEAREQAVKFTSS